MTLRHNGQWNRALAVAGQGALATMEAALERWFSPSYRANNPPRWMLCATGGCLRTRAVTPNPRGFGRWCEGNLTKKGIIKGITPVSL